MDKTQAYKIVNDNPLYDIINQIIHFLQTWLTNKYITTEQYENLWPVHRKYQLAHLYYLPQAHKQGTPLRPICASINSPTARLSQFLDNLLRPLFKQSTSTSIENGIYIVQQLKSYSRSEQFTPKTLFITFDIVDLYTMLNHNLAIFYLRRFLQEGLQLTALDGIPIDVIIKICNLVLKNNYFYYDNNYYHQIKGGAMGSSLTLSLANIYMKY
ncbi:unnamed protein product [Didymodactylos carnosus]|uniref:Reverse transcriptase domain-containing protein n=1 Tax=Didymodactylos carnosus TaxID=1234261 RepID=A0A815SAN8_9BILA|nr:unnamed protein product [Didymodactylos carnosus]CAF4353234.1 unnamed protein product [Didymodactylos carnosus]